MGQAASKRRSATERQRDGEQCNDSELHKQKKKSKGKFVREAPLDRESTFNSRINMFSKEISTVAVSSGVRRTTIPDRPSKFSVNIWSILKNNIGKDLFRIPMPVHFSEPLSMLQRLTEIYEYSYLLDEAAECRDSLQQLAILAAFSISCYSSTADRTCKPFNPLLGETYECDRREDLGWRAISEQVSHHPPIVAQYCEGKSWTCWQDFSVTTKFKGQSIHVAPHGIHHCEFKDSKNHYIWTNVASVVHNVIFGKLWVDQEGDSEVVDIIKNCKCKLTYIPYSKSGDQRRVTGHVIDGSGLTRWVIEGNWTSYVDIAPVIVGEGSKNQVLKTGPYKNVWRINQPPENDQIYNFSYFACQLNELEERIAPTDSRLRPDQRLMEEGFWPQADEVKIILEEKQRTRQRVRESESVLVCASSSSKTSDCYDPIWFRKESDPLTKQITYVYKGGYWESKQNQDWSKCPDIFAV